MVTRSVDSASSVSVIPNALLMNFFCKLKSSSFFLVDKDGLKTTVSNSGSLINKQRLPRIVAVKTGDCNLLPYLRIKVVIPFRPISIPDPTYGIIDVTCGGTSTTAGVSVVVVAAESSLQLLFHCCNFFLVEDDEDDDEKILVLLTVYAADKTTTAKVVAKKMSGDVVTEIVMVARSLPKWTHSQADSLSVVSSFRHCFSLLESSGDPIDLAARSCENMFFRSLLCPDEGRAS